MKALTTVAKKELRELARDRKTLLLTLFMSPLIILLMVFGIGTFAKKKFDTQMDKPLSVAIVNADKAPNLVAWLGEQGVARKPVADPDGAIRAQDEDAYIRISENYADDWAAGRPALVEVVSDSTRQDAEVPTQRLTTLLNLYSRQVGALRLLGRGISPGFSVPMVVAGKDLSTPEARRSRALAFLPYLLILGGFIGAAAFVIDMTAGERERQSLEPLLTTPAPRMQIVSGKIAAAVLVGLATVTLTCLAFKLGAQFTPGLGHVLDVSLVAVAKMLLVLVPMVAIGNALLTVIASRAKSVKEAQSYMSMLMLLPMLPTIFLMVSPVKNQPWMFAVPFLAQNQVLLKILRSETVTVTEWLVYFGAGIALAGVLWGLAVRRYRNEALAVAS